MSSASRTPVSAAALDERRHGIDRRAFAKATLPDDPHQPCRLKPHQRPPHCSGVSADPPCNIGLCGAGGAVPRIPPEHQPNACLCPAQVPKCEINKRIENTEAVLLLFAAAVGCRS